MAGFLSYVHLFMHCNAPEKNIYSFACLSLGCASGKLCWIQIILTFYFIPIYIGIAS